MVFDACRILLLVLEKVTVCEMATMEKHLKDLLSETGEMGKEKFGGWKVRDVEKFSPCARRKVQDTRQSVSDCDMLDWNPYSVL